MFNLNKPLKLQLEKIFPDYIFYKTSEKYLKESINLFFNLKLNSQEITVGEFCFFFKLNSINTNDIKDFPISFLKKFKEEFILFLNPNYFKLNTVIKTLSDDTNLCLNLLYYISKAHSFDLGKLNPLYKNLFLYSELNKYVYKTGDLKIACLKDIKFINLLDIDELIYLRKEFMKKYIPASILGNFKYLESLGFFIDDFDSFSIGDYSTNRIGNTNEFEFQVSVSNGKETKELIIPFGDQFRIISLKSFYIKNERNKTNYLKIKQDYLSSLI